MSVSCAIRFRTSTEKMVRKAPTPAWCLHSFYGMLPQGLKILCIHSSFVSVRLAYSSIVFSVQAVHCSFIGPMIPPSKDGEHEAESLGLERRGLFASCGSKGNRVLLKQISISTHGPPHVVPWCSGAWWVSEFGFAPPPGLWWVYLGLRHLGSREFLP